MKRTLIHTAFSALLAGAFAFAPAALQAQETSKTNAPASAEPNKHEIPRLHGKVTAVDLTAKTVTLGKNTYEVTSQTKIYMDNKPATLEDIKVGDRVMGTYKHAGEKKILVRISNWTAPPEGGAPATPPADTK